MSNSFNYVIQILKNAGYSKEIINAKNKTKTKWNIIRRETGRENIKQNINSILVKNKTITDKVTIVEHFNTFFTHEPSFEAARACVTKALDVLSQYKPSLDFFYVFRANKLTSSIKHCNILKNKKPSEWDAISTNLFKFLGGEITVPLKSRKTNQSIARVWSVPKKIKTGGN